MRRKKIKIITLTKATKDVFRKQLINLLGDSVDIYADSVEEGVYKEENIDLVLSTHLLVKSIEKYLWNYDKDKVIFARRSISASAVKKLIAVPQGTEALLISTNKSSVEETLILFKNIGIDHIKFIPVYPGKRMPDTDMAIVTGETGGYLPNNAEIIDIGRRIISISTVVRVLTELRLLDQYEHVLITDYIKELVKLNKNLNKKMLEEKKANKMLETVINNVFDGIVYINKERRIKIFNDVAKNIFNVDNKIINSKANDTSLSINLDDFLNKNNKNLDKIKEIENGKKILMNVIPIHDDKDMAGDLMIFKDVTEIKKLEQQVRRKLKRKGHTAKYTFNHIIGESEIIRKTKEKALNIAEGNNTILIEGETGTGKELFAQAIHNRSDYKRGPFVPINCATVPEELFESELFGYKEGAFSGAKKGGKTGVFEQAHNGTIFLDEISEIPLNVQTKLLRVLQEKEIMRVGGTEIIPITVRVIAATNRKLREMVDKNKFREDLFYRINVFPIKIPPLREHKEDILVLIEYFLNEFDNNEIELTKETISKLYNYEWPGNIRELQNCVQYIKSVCKDKVKVTDLPNYIFSQKYKNNYNDYNLKEAEKLIELNSLGNPKEYKFILNELHLAKKNGEYIGRREIAENSEVNGLSLSPQMVRTRLKKLEKHKLVEIRRGRKGTIITEKGEKLIK